MLDSFDTQDGIRDEADILAHTPHGNDLQAVVCVKMDVHGTDDLVMMGVLNLIEFILEV